MRACLPLVQAKWPGYSHVCEGFNESDDMKPKAWNSGEELSTTLTLAKPGLEVRACTVTHLTCLFTRDAVTDVALYHSTALQYAAVPVHVVESSCTLAVVVVVMGGWVIIGTIVLVIVSVHVPKRH